MQLGWQKQSVPFVIPQTPSYLMKLVRKLRGARRHDGIVVSITGLTWTLRVRSFNNSVYDNLYQRYKLRYYRLEISDHLGCGAS